MRFFLRCALPLLLCACASEQWTKADGAVATRQVLSECSQQSMARAGAEGLSNGTYIAVPPGVSGAKTGRVEFPSNQVPPPNTGIQEQGYFNLCMRDKGYDLLPAAPKTKP